MWSIFLGSYLWGLKKNKTCDGFFIEYNSYRVISFLRNVIPYIYFLNLRNGSLLDITLIELYLSWGFIFDYNFWLFFLIMVFFRIKFLKMSNFEGQYFENVKFWGSNFEGQKNVLKIKLLVETFEKIKFW